MKAFGVAGRISDMTLNPDRSIQDIWLSGAQMQPFPQEIGLPDGRLTVV
jgi:hypothetical protein